MRANLLKRTNAESFTLTGWLFFLSKQNTRHQPDSPFTVWPFPICDTSLNKTRQTFSEELHLRGAGLAVLHGPHWMYVLTHRSRNCWLSALKTSGGTKRDCLASSPSLGTNPHAKSKLFQFPKHTYVTALMGRWLLSLPRAVVSSGFGPTYCRALNRATTLFCEYHQVEVRSCRRGWTESSEQGRGNSEFLECWAGSWNFLRLVLTLWLRALHSSKPGGDRLRTSVHDSSDLGDFRALLRCCVHCARSCSQTLNHPPSSPGTVTHSASRWLPRLWVQSCKETGVKV